MKKEKVNTMRNGEQRILEISAMKNIEKAVIVEDNIIYTYGYKGKGSCCKH